MKYERPKGKFDWSWVREQDQFPIVRVARDHDYESSWYWTFQISSFVVRFRAPRLWTNKLVRLSPEQLRDGTIAPQRKETQQQ